MGTAATRLAVALDRLEGAKTRLAGGGESPLAKIVRDFEGMAQPLRTVKLPPSARAQLVSDTVLISEFSDRYL